MKQILQRLAAGIAVLGVVAGVAVAPAHAEGETESIAMSPTNVRLTTDPGKEYSGTLKVMNDGQVGYDVLVYARPYSVQGKNYEPVFNAPSGNLDAYTWVQFDKTTFHLNAGENTEVKYTVRVPENAKSGSHTAVMFAETQSQANSGGSVVRKKRVGQIVYATVGGDNKVAGDVASYSIPFLQTAKPLHASSLVNNTGTTDFVDETKVTVRDVFGSEKYAQTRSLAVLPNQPREMQYDWNDSSSFGLYHVTVSHTFLGKSVSSAGYVLMIPVWALVAILLLIVGAVVYAVAKRRRKA